MKAVTKANREKQAREAKLAASLAKHRRYAELERLIGDRHFMADAYSREWTTEQTDLEIELAGLGRELENED